MLLDKDEAAGAASACKILHVGRKWQYDLFHATIPLDADEIFHPGATPPSLNYRLQLVLELVMPQARDDADSQNTLQTVQQFFIQVNKEQQQSEE